MDTLTNSRWEALVSSDYEWLMPLPIKSKYGIKYIATPPFIQQLGIFGPSDASEELITHFINESLKRVAYLDLKLNWKNILINDFRDEKTQRTNLILDISADYEDIKSNYSDNLKRNIQKANNSSLSFSHCSIRNIISLFQNDRGKKLKVANAAWYNSIDQIYNVASFRSKGKCLGVYDKSGELLAGMFILEWQGKATFIFSGNSESGKKIGALPALIDYYIQNAGDTIKEFDFEGSDDEGLKRFYKSFGSVESNYVHLIVNRLPFYLRWLKA
ncbi:MAG: hypothetical protein WED33_07480 [Bacteroidia bacterium]